SFMQLRIGSRSAISELGAEHARNTKSECIISLRISQEFRLSQNMLSTCRNFSSLSKQNKSRLKKPQQEAFSFDVLFHFLCFVCVDLPRAKIEERRIMNPIHGQL